MLNIIEAEVIGLRSYSFTNNSGREIFMTQLYCTFTDKSAEGLCALSLSIPERKSVEDAIGLGCRIMAAWADKKWQYVGTK